MTTPSVAMADSWWGQHTQGKLTRSGRASERLTSVGVWAWRKQPPRTGLKVTNLPEWEMRGLTYYMAYTFPEACGEKLPQVHCIAIVIDVKSIERR